MRAVFGTPPLDRSTVQAVGYWFARLSLPPARPAGSRPLLILGGDTRDSREEIAGWLAAAVRAAGADVRSAGVVPTPAVAFLVTELGAMGGIVVSASHNPSTDNGVKLIGADGFKVDPSVVLGFDTDSASRPIAAVHFRKEQTMELETASALADMILAAQRALIARDEL